MKIGKNSKIVTSVSPRAITTLQYFLILSPSLTYSLKSRSGYLSDSNFPSNTLIPIYLIKINNKIKTITYPTHPYYLHQPSGLTKIINNSNSNF